MITPWVMRIIIANVAMYLVTTAVPLVTEKLMLVPAFILLRPWSIITYMFLHANAGHIFFNMLSLFFFGPRLEIELGSRSFLWLYFISGIMGGILSFFFTPLTAIIGASGAVYGVMLGFAYFWPRERMYVWGILPVESRWLIIAMTAISLFGGFGGGGSGIAHFAHLGGFLGGFLYLRLAHPASGRREFQQPAVLSTTPSDAEISRWSQIRREGMHEVNREELDRVMTKINSLGAGSLTAQEIAFLNRFSAR